MQIVLCGMMGCGKTTVGKCLAERLGWDFVDTDEWIVERHGEISPIFASYGEEYFRSIEAEAVRALTGRENLVVAVGGGAVLNEENVCLLKSQGEIVYLQASKETLVKRLVGDETRPLLQGEALTESVEKLLRERQAIYERVSDSQINVDEKTPALIVGEIIEKMNLCGAGA